MGLFNFLRTKKANRTAFANGSYVDPVIRDDELKALVHEAILVFQHNTDMDQDGIIDLIKTYCDDENLALALYRFIPIAYTRLFIPEAAYSDEYILFKSPTDKTTFYFSKDNLYRLIFTECHYQFSQSTGADHILPVLYHSAEFKAINSALLDGSDLKNLLLSPAYFLTS